MRLEQKEADKAVMPKTKPRAKFGAAALAGLAFLVASPEHFINTGAPIPTAFTI